jgi:5-(carboxyamino)imidazole ribonucleotide synthase
VIREMSDAEDAFAAMNGQPAILEAFADFTVELSIIAARGLDGEVVAYPAVREPALRRHSARKLRPR